MKSDKRFQILLWQYRECLHFIRNFQSMIWQLPSLSMAINTFLAITYLGYAKTFEARLVILLASLFFTFVSTVQLQKQIFAEVARIDGFKWVQDQLRKLLQKTDSMREIKLTSEEIRDDVKGYPSVHRTFWTRRGASAWFKRSMYATIFTICLLLSYEVGMFLTSVMN